MPAKSHHYHFLLPAKSPLKTCILCNFFLSSINWLFTFLFYLSVWLFLSKSAFAVFSLSASSSWTKLQSIFMIIIQTILIILDNNWTIPKTKDLSSAVSLRLFLKQLQGSSSLVQRPLHRPGCSHFHETKHCTETEMLLCRQQIFEQLNKNSVQPTQASSGSQKQGGAELRLLQPAKFEVMINEKHYQESYP